MLPQGLVASRGGQVNRHVRAIIGCRKHGEVTPSSDVARKLVEAFGVKLDSLVLKHEQSAFAQDSSMLKRVRAIGELFPDDPDKLLYATEVCYVMPLLT